MLDIKFIRDNKDIVEAAIKNKKVKAAIDLDEILKLADERKLLRTKIDEINREKNVAAENRDIEKGTQLKKDLVGLEEQFNQVDKKYIQSMLLLPNVPSADTPVGEDENANKVLRQIGEKSQFDFEPKEHWELGKDLGIIDNETAAEISGSRFTFLKGDLALMQFALIQHALNILTDKDILIEIAKKVNIDIPIDSFIPIVPPVFIKPAILNRMARLEPKEDRYHFAEDDLYLIGSAEHTLGPIHMDQIIPEVELPIRYVGYSTAFRREAGSYGKDTKGIFRMHQFDKMEMETFCLPEHSYQEQDFLVAIQEHLMQTLGIPYEVMIVCTGDMGLPDHRQIDINAWMPGQNKYRETHSSDLIGAFQPIRLSTRVKRTDGKVEPVHMNDATVFAVGRTLIAIMENYQQADGSIKIPEVLQKYMGGRSIISKEK